MKTTIRSAAVAVLSFTMVALAGCATPGKRTLIGGGAGAAVGAGVGGAVGHDRGAVIGACVGAVVGAAAGNYLDKRAQELEKVAETKKTERGLMVKLQNDVLFDFNSATLKALRGVTAWSGRRLLGAAAGLAASGSLRVGLHEGASREVGMVLFGPRSSRRLLAARATRLRKGLQKQVLSDPGGANGESITNSVQSDLT